MSYLNNAVLECRNLRVIVDDNEIIRGVDLTIAPGEVHALMGPNGSGKSTLVNALAGHPGYRVEGEIWLNGEQVQSLEPEERAHKGLFLGFQYPVAIPGVTTSTMLRTALKAKQGEAHAPSVFLKELKRAFSRLDIPWEFASRYINDGFSGGEKKRLEVLQMLMLEPRVALLDEIDSGLDIDALKVAASGIQQIAEQNTGVLLVTHYQRILAHVKPHVVHVLVGGRIVKSGGPEQALELEDRGYEWLEPEIPLAAGRGAT